METIDLIIASSILVNIILLIILMIMIKSMNIGNNIIYSLVEKSNINFKENNKLITHIDQITTKTNDNFHMLFLHW